MGHDAVVTTATAIRDTEGLNPQPKLVIQAFKSMNGINSIGGSQWLVSLDENGKPINKAVPILEVNPDGTVGFVKLSAPRGEPCRPDVSALC